MIGIKHSVIITMLIFNGSKTCLFYVFLCIFLNFQNWEKEARNSIKKSRGSKSPEFLRSSSVCTFLAAKSWPIWLPSLLLPPSFRKIVLEESAHCCPPLGLPLSLPISMEHLSLPVIKIFDGHLWYWRQNQRHLVLECSSLIPSSAFSPCLFPMLLIPTPDFQSKHSNGCSVC